MWRRRWYARHPARRRRLARPVISVGNLRVGGSGKTPTVAYLAGLLVGLGERPAVLTRGYGRRVAEDGVTVVCDGAAILADVDRAGDEPLMLARRLTGVPVLVSADRYVAGRFGEQRLGATVHLLDDGFQHLQLARDIDLLLVDGDDLADRPLPEGRLREPLADAAAADAVLVAGGAQSEAERVGAALGIPTAFHVTRSLGPPRLLRTNEPVVQDASPVVVAAAIARPARFVSDVAAAGWVVSEALTFRDHQWFDDRDLGRIRAAAARAGGALVLTTEKDAERLAVCHLAGLRVAAVPLTVSVEPAVSFERWIADRLRRARE